EQVALDNVPAASPGACSLPYGDCERINQIAFSPSGSLVAIEVFSHRVVELMPGIEGEGTVEGENLQFVHSEDGREIYYFDANGRHLYTRDGVTGTVTRRFHHDDQGRLTGVEDQLGRSLTIDHSVPGQVTI